MSGNKVRSEPVLSVWPNSGVWTHTAMGVEAGLVGFGA